MLARRITFLRTLRTKLNHLLTYCCRLFVALEKVKSYRISNFQTLFAKHPGVGGGDKPPIHAMRSSLRQSFVFTTLRIPFFATPFFSHPSKTPGEWGASSCYALIFSQGRRTPLLSCWGEK